MENFATNRGKHFESSSIIDGFWCEMVNFKFCAFFYSRKSTNAVCSTHSICHYSITFIGHTIQYTYSIPIPLHVHTHVIIKYGIPYRTHICMRVIVRCTRIHTHRHIIHDTATMRMGDFFSLHIKAHTLRLFSSYILTRTVTHSFTLTLA